MISIDVSDGRTVRLSPHVDCHRTLTGFLVCMDDMSLAIEADFEGAITPNCAEELTRKGIASLEGQLLFEKPDLAKDIFGWDCKAEIDFLARSFQQFGARLGLDVACGYGRLLLPLAERGFRVHGVDESLPQIGWLTARLKNYGDCAVFRASIEEFVQPGAYHYAYSGMNSLRYLETGVAWKKHFLCMRRNLAPGSPYLVAISIVKEPQEPYEQRWIVNHGDIPIEVRWSRVAFCHLRKQILEKIDLVDLRSQRLIHTEYQRQAHYSPHFLRDYFSRAENGWEFDRLLTNSFDEAEMLSDNLNGTYWLILTRV